MDTLAPTATAWTMSTDGYALLIKVPGVVEPWPTDPVVTPEECRHRN
jgi:hypothetical protein